MTLSFVGNEDLAHSLRELNAVAAALPAGVELWVGGAGVRQFPPDQVPARCRMLADLAELERQSDALVGRRA